MQTETNVTGGGGGQGAMPPPPPRWSASKKKGKRIENNKLPLIMTFNVQENAVFIHEFLKALPWEGETHDPHPPPRGRFAPTPPPPVEKKSWPRQCWVKLFCYLG